MRDGDYPRPVAFELFGEDRLAMLAGVNVGMPVQVRFFAESREGKNGNIFTSTRCTDFTSPTVVSSTPANNTPLYGQWDSTTKLPHSTSAPTSGNILSQENDLPFDDDLGIF